MSKKAIPVNYPDQNPHLQQGFDAMRQAAPRDPLQAAQARQVFLQEAQNMSLAVSPEIKRRHIGWMVSIQNLLKRKEHSPMFGAFGTIILIFSLFLGGTGISVAAAQSSLPDQPLYALKLFSEQLRLRLNEDPQQEWQLALDFANRRMTEIKTMVQGGDVPPEPVQGQYQEQVEQTIQFAVGMPDEQALRALEQIRQRLQTQEHSLDQSACPDNPQCEAVLLRAQEMLQERLRWVEDGLDDPAQLREQFRQRQKTTPGAQEGGNPWTTGSPTPGSGYGPGPASGECPDCTPAQNKQGGNPWTDNTPTPGSGYGPGPGDGDCTGCTPEGNSSGGNPWTDETPTPGSGYGPGPQPTEPPGGQPAETGPQPTQSGPNGPQVPSEGPGEQPASQPGNGGKP